MFNKIRQSGFSLLEVMMAVVVLMMGMVFVASMFPVGLHNSRINVERTINSIEANNAAVMAELIIENNRSNAIDRLMIDYATRAEPYLKESFFNMRSGFGFTNTVHFIPRPNVLADLGDVIIADFEYEYDGTNFTSQTELSYMLTSSGGVYSATFGGDQLLPFSPLVSSCDPLDGVFTNPYTPAINFDNYEMFQLATDYYVLHDNGVNISYSILTGDIGKICCPVVDENHPDVVALAGSYDPYDVAERRSFLYPAIYQVALEQKYNWAAAYTEGDDPYELSIFILKQNGSNLRYAVQDPTTAVVANVNETYLGYNLGSYGNIGITNVPLALPEEYDCRFPVPWLVYLSNPGSNSNAFFVNDNVANLLRPGSVIIDADPEFYSFSGNINFFNHNNSVGGLFRVKDVQQDINDEDGYANTTYKITLETNLNDSSRNNFLFAFWVFPPAIDRDTNEFATEQPVIDVIKKTYRY